VTTRTISQLVATRRTVAADAWVADIIKTKYTGDPENVSHGCHAVAGAIIIAGGPLVPIESMLTMAHEALGARSAGISLGRNIFGRDDPTIALAR